jgi:hypothetical protein
MHILRELCIHCLYAGIFTREAMKNYRALEAYKTFFLSGWVRTVYHLIVPPTHNTVLKADVMPSQSLNAECHHPWVCLKSDGCVISSHCDCMAG